MKSYLTRVLIAGIGGASLGTEILKCLLSSKKYKIYGCDVSKFAYGHYEDGFVNTFPISRKNYINSIKKIVKKCKIQIIIPGGEEPLTILQDKIQEFEKMGAMIAANHPSIIKLCSNKLKLFSYLSQCGVTIPLTKSVTDTSDLESFSYPCVIKPSSDSGGSKFVFLSSNKQESIQYLKFLTKNGQEAIVQEYIPEEEGEFTIGVLSLPNGRIVSSIAMRRLLTPKLSVSLKTKNGIISSGYSQGLIDDFKKIRKQAEKIAQIIQSRGPLNIQGRIRKGTLLPFEINPRFSASTYLRTLAGFNEIDIYLQYLIYRKTPKIKPLKKGYYLRSFSEKFVDIRKIKNGSVD